MLKISTTDSQIYISKDGKPHCGFPKNTLSYRLLENTMELFLVAQKGVLFSENFDNAVSVDDVELTRENADEILSALFSANTGGGSGSDINVVQTTGTSTEDVMSQAAVTSAISKMSGTMPNVKRMYVNPSYADGDSDGTFARPFTTITEALDLITEYTIIDLAPGDYMGESEINITKDCALVHSVDVIEPYCWLPPLNVTAGMVHISGCYTMGIMLNQTGSSDEFMMKNCLIARNLEILSHNYTYLVDCVFLPTKADVIIRGAVSRYSLLYVWSCIDISVYCEIGYIRAYFSKFNKLVTSEVTAVTGDYVAIYLPNSESYCYLHGCDFLYNTTWAADSSYDLVQAGAGWRIYAFGCALGGSNRNRDDVFQEYITNCRIQQSTQNYTSASNRIVDHLKGIDAKLGELQSSGNAVINGENNGADVEITTDETFMVNAKEGVELNSENGYIVMESAERLWLFGKEGVISTSEDLELKSDEEIYIGSEYVSVHAHEKFTYNDREVAVKEDIDDILLRIGDVLSLDDNSTADDILSVIGTPSVFIEQLKTGKRLVAVSPDCSYDLNYRISDDGVSVNVYLTFDTINVPAEPNDLNSWSRTRHYVHVYAAAADLTSWSIHVQTKQIS